MSLIFQLIGNVSRTKVRGDKHRARKVWVKKLGPNRRIEWEKTIERSNRRRINIDCLAQVGIRHSGAELTTFGGI